MINDASRNSCATFPDFFLRVMTGKMKENEAESLIYFAKYALLLA